jgi:hypothetical protein
LLDIDCFFVQQLGRVLDFPEFHRYIAYGKAEALPPAQSITSSPESDREIDNETHFPNRDHEHFDTRERCACATICC